MKALLLHQDRDLDAQQGLPRHAPALIQDLELERLFRAMAAGDEYLLDVARKVVLSAMKNDIETILYRQEIGKDCLKNPGVVRQLYDLALEAISREKNGYWGFLSTYPGSILHRAIQGLEAFTEVLRKLRRIAEEQSGRFESRGFTALFAMLRKELSDEYLASVQDHLTELKFKRGVLLTAELGKGNAMTQYLLRKPRGETKGWLARLLGKSPPGYTFRLHPRDEAGGRILSEMRDRGINLVANALGQSRDHVLSFFVTLRAELAFYIGCLNLHERLAAMEEPSSFPRPVPAGQRRHSFSELYDVCLALTMNRRVAGNSMDADGKRFVIITGANQGGKSTFLRSIGLAQLMMHSGMFVPAKSFEAELCSGLFTHYKREEDPTMKSGKLDEELGRMSDIADHMGPDALVLFNESFAATNEREGSEIATQIVRALLERRIKVFFVTHLYEFAHGFFDRRMEDALFLRAERRADGTRTFRLIEGEPLETSYGEDLYREIFAVETAQAGAGCVSATPPVSTA
jgi:DNA mismatch repair ATPase MutS